MQDEGLYVAITVYYLSKTNQQKQRSKKKGYYQKKKKIKNKVTLKAS